MTDPLILINFFTGGSNRNQPIGSAFSSNIGSNTSKMGFFGKKDETETNHSDIFYGKNFPSGRSNLADNIVIYLCIFM